LIFTIPLGFTPGGLALATFGGSLIQADINEGFNAKEENRSPSFENVIQETIIGGSVGFGLSSLPLEPFVINKGWIRPTIPTTSFIGNYQKKLVANNAVSSIITNSVNNIINDIVSIVSKKNTSTIIQNIKSDARSKAAIFGIGMSQFSGK